jgi:hypothetical protein
LPAGLPQTTTTTTSSAAAAAEVEAAEQTVAAPARKPTLLSQPAPETYAIVEISGKQMFVEPGKWYVTNRLKVSCPQQGDGLGHSRAQARGAGVPSCCP